MHSPIASSIIRMRAHGLTRLILAALLLFLPLTAFAQLAGPVRLKEGRLSGVKGSDPSVTVFKGIPYAAPPVGNLRWAAPQPAASWQGVRRADTYSAGCIQDVARSRPPWTEEFMHQGEVSEDCLYLNVWTAARASSERRPVLVYIHGGGFNEGSGSIAVYDGEALAKKGPVVVTINYRVGILGFLVHPELSAESGRKASGNYGLLDQVAALQWVRNNIAAFGGDPNNVTIAGQSAGAMSVYLLTASPLAKGLFHRAISQSGPGGLASFGASSARTLARPLAEAEPDGVAFALARGASTIRELRALPVADLTAPLKSGVRVPRMGTVIDGYFLTDNPASVYERGQQNDVPMLTGFNADEPSAFPGYGSAPPARKDSLRRVAATALQSLMAERARTAKTNAFLYYFERGIPWPERPEFGAFHTAEVPYVFNNLNQLNRPWEEIDRRLADAVSSYWANFAAKGDPNGPGLPRWPAFPDAPGSFMVLGDRIAPREMAAATQAKRRSESFFGLHFDHHAQIHEKDAGKTLTVAMIDSILIAARPDFIQVDTKGHPGITSYPTKVGTAMASFEKDPLQLLREVTTRHGVGLYSHYSGVWDTRAVELHPEWGVVGLDGKRDKQITSPFSPYADQILIPQLKELSDYGIDGVWVDGEAWAAKPDFSEQAKAEFRKKTGLAPPASADDPNYVAYLGFARDLFEAHVAHYVRAMRAYNPKFQVASNWAYSSFMPVPVEMDVDFLSGDVASGNSVYSAAFEARCLAPQGHFFKKPWDLMAWSFVYNFDGTPKRQSPKTTVHILQEAAETIAMGGGFQVYYTQAADLALPTWIVPQVAEIGRFMRERQPYTQGAVPVPQVALLYSSAAYRQLSRSVYGSPGGWADGLRGYNAMLLDGRHPTEILMEHHLQGRLDAYPLIVVPEWGILEPAFRDSLVAYVRRGGNLLVAGVDAVKQFEKELGVRFAGEPKRTAHFLGYEGQMAGIDSRYQPVEALSGTEVLGRFYTGRHMRDGYDVAASVTRLGKGRIGGIYLDLGSYYQHASTPLHRDFVSAVVRRLFPAPAVRVEGRGPLHVTLNRVANRTAVNLINAGGQHKNPEVSTYDDIVPLGPQQVTLRMAERPGSVTLQPGNRKLAFEYSDGLVRLTVPGVELHEIVVVD